MNSVEIYYPYQEHFSVFEQTMVNGVQEPVPKTHLFVGIIVWKENIATAKAALYFNPYIRYKTFSPALVGAYQALEASDSVQVLFQEIEKIGGGQGKDYLIGPMNGSTWEDYRFHDDPDIPLFFMEMKHNACYPKQWKSVGFRPMAHYLSTIAPVEPHQNQKIEQVKRRLLRDGVTIRPIEMDHYEAELRKLHPFLHESFQQNFLYTPIDESAFLAKYLPLWPLLNPEFVQIAEHAGEVVGVVLGVDDLLNPENKTLIIKTLTRNPKRLYRGLGLVLVDECYQKSASRDYRQTIFAFMIEEGDATPLSDRYNGHHFKNYTLYGKAI